MKEILDFITSHFSKTHLFILFLLFLLAIILIIIIIRLHKRNSNSLKHAIKSKHNLSHLKIDLLNKTVYEFSNENLHEAKKITLNEFYQQYSDKDIQSLNRWLFNQLSKKVTESNYKEILKTSKKKVSTKHILMCNSVDAERNILHLDRYIVNSSSNIKQDYEIERCFFKLKKKSITDIALISFYFKDEKLLKNKSPLNQIQIHQIIDKLSRISDSHHLLNLLKNGDIGIIIFNQKNTMPYLNKLKNELSIFLTISNLDSISFHITVYRNQGDKINYSDCLKKDRLVSNYLLDNKQYIPQVLYFSENKNYSCKKKSNQVDKIKRAIFNNEFEAQIIPFFNSKDGRVAFHKFEVFARDESITSKNEISECVYMNSIQKEYLEMIFSKLEESFMNVNKERNYNNQILIKTNLWLLESILEYLPIFQLKHNYQFICCISNLEIKNNFEENTLKLLQELKDLGLKIAIELNSIEKPHEKILSYIDYVVLDEISLSSFFSDQQSSFLLTSLLNYVKNMKITIAAYNISDWSTLESMICNFATIISAKCLEQENKISLGLDKKVSSKLKLIYYKYH